jgi:hypothetical protein
MKHWYYTLRFFLACVVIFGGGYFFAKPRNDADKVFAPGIAGIAVYSLWRSRKSSDLSISN